MNIPRDSEKSSAEYTQSELLLNAPRFDDDELLYDYTLKLKGRGDLGFKTWKYGTDWHRSEVWLQGCKDIGV